MENRKTENIFFFASNKFTPSEIFKLMNENFSKIQFKQI